MGFYEHTLRVYILQSNYVFDKEKKRSFWEYFMWIFVQIVILAMLRVGAGFVYQMITDILSLI